MSRAGIRAWARQLKNTEEFTRGVRRGLPQRFGTAGKDGGYE